MKTKYKEKIKDLGIGLIIIGIGIFLVLFMIGWLIYKIFISSIGWAS